MRGGLRSSSIAWYLHRAGLDVEVLAGGYKAFKQWARGLWTLEEEEEKKKAGVETGGASSSSSAALLPSPESNPNPNPRTRIPNPHSNP